ncbi:probable ascorbate-specific transmembrane electron transporter 1 [Macadamia integrifolia]|uniref:probable ascorbate-specific transmembrane electron transporter 1 n=1 Tax=Macadamia integrifolia TaxID=60698 RepID=UPI001C4F4E15|nr:probable ascorbate-specific transmembrane electron transporter 1 [Macadamia integrifolia]
MVPLTMVTHLLGIGAAVMVLVWCIHFRGGLAFEATNKSLIFNIHPVLTLIGVIILGGEAIISHKSVPFSKGLKKLIHLTLHAIALIFGIIGTYAAFKYHHECSAPNLFSLHSWMGIGVIFLYAIQWIYGFVVFCYPAISAGIRAQSLPPHVLFGLFVYILAVATALLGFLEKLTFLENSDVPQYGPEAYLVNFTAVVTILFGVSIVLTAISPPPRTVAVAVAEDPGKSDIEIFGISDK